MMATMATDGAGRRSRRSARASRLAIAFAAAAAAAIAAPHTVAAANPETRDEVSIVEAAATGDAGTFAEALARAFAAELSEAGIVSTRVGPAADPSRSDAELAAFAAGSEARWAAIARCSIESRRLVWRLAVHDSLDGAVVAADAGGAFAGLSAALALEESAARVAEALAARAPRLTVAPLLAYRLRFESRDDGALVSFGVGDDAEPAGTIAWHGLSAPYAPLAEGKPILVTVSKEGRWPRIVEVTPGRDDVPIQLPELQIKARGAVSAAWSINRPFGAGLEYRHHLAPDLSFARIGNHLWFGDAQGTEARSVMHDEISIGLGLYALRPKDAALRLAFGAGASAMATIMRATDADARYWLDAAIDPLVISIEWHSGDTAYVFEERLSYSVGLESGLLKRGWLGYSGPPVAIGIGVMRKWP